MAEHGLRTLKPQPPAASPSGEARSSTASFPAAGDASAKKDGSDDVCVEEEARAVGSRVHDQDVPPDGGYGWVCVICSFWINAHTWGLNSSYGVFLDYYLNNNTFPGSSDLQFAFIGGLSISTALLISPIATTTTRLYGTRTTLMIGVVFEAVSFIGASFASQIWHLFLSQGVCFGWGMGFLFVGSVAVVPQWFSSRRSLAMGIASAGSGIGGLIYSLAANALIQRVSLAWAFRVLGILAFAVNFICSALMRDRNKEVKSTHLAFDYRLFKRYEFCLLQLFGILSMLGYVVLLFSLPNYATSVGMTARQGSVIGAVLNLGQAVGRPPIGYFSDTLGRINMAGIMTFLAGLFSLVIWVFAESFGVLVFYALVGGTVAGTYWAVVSPVTAEVVGLSDLASALSITWVMLVLPTTFSEPVALQITSMNGGRYLGAQLFAGFMYLGAAASMFLLRGWKMSELRSQAAASKVGVSDVGQETGEAVGSSSSRSSSSNSITQQSASNILISDCLRRGRV